MMMNRQTRIASEGAVGLIINLTISAVISIKQQHDSSEISLVFSVEGERRRTATPGAFVVQSNSLRAQSDGQGTCEFS
jgi:hypothetical protein